MEASFRTYAQDHRAVGPLSTHTTDSTCRMKRLGRQKCRCHLLLLCHVTLKLKSHQLLSH